MEISLIPSRELWEIREVTRRSRAVPVSGKSIAAIRENNVQVYDRPDHVSTAGIGLFAVVRVLTLVQICIKNGDTF
jgi:hypothetical protein